MPDGLDHDFPLFPLGLVALPGEYVPLHVFEARYRTMIEECLESELEFGIVWLTDSGLKPTGCACGIEQVLERMDDGRVNILTRGTRPFDLVARTDARPYPAGTVRFVSDVVEDAEEEAGERAHSVYAKLVERATDRVIEPDELATMDAYAMAATVELELEPKQRLLELRSENERLRLVARLLEDALRRVDVDEIAEARARTNGRVHH